MFTEDLNVLKCNQRIFFTDTIPDVWCAVGKKKKATDVPGDKILHCKSGTNLKHVFAVLQLWHLWMPCKDKFTPCFEDNNLILQVLVLHFIYKQNRNWRSFFYVFVNTLLRCIETVETFKYHDTFLACHLKFSEH